MFVKRCGFYIEDNSIVRKDVWIDWDIDMSKENRYLYANKIKKELGNELEPIVDTTTASTNYLGKKLSSYWNKIEGMNCIEAYNLIAEEYDKEHVVPGIFEYIYYSAMTESSLKFVKQTRTFMNMFFNPDKVSTCDALACAALKLLIKQGKFDYINDPESICWWCYGNIGTMKIISAGDKPKEPEHETGSYTNESSDDYSNWHLPDVIDDELPFA